MIPVPLSWAGIAVAAAIGGTVLIYEGLPFLIDGRVDHTYAAGRQTEKQVWEALRRREADDREIERQAAQDKIAAAEADYWRQTEIQKFRISELERAIAADQTDPSPAVPPQAGAAAACPPAISRRLRDALDATGR